MQKMQLNNKNIDCASIVGLCLDIKLYTTEINTSS